MRRVGIGFGRVAAMGAVLAAAWCGQSASAQTDDGSGGYTLSVSARVVTVPVTARDSKGKLLDNLTKDDFTLTEDGVEQRIRYLSVDKDRPLTVGLLIDTSGSEKENIPQERAAATKFLGTMLTKPEDASFIVRFDNALAMLAKKTSSKPDLTAALGHLEDKHEPRLDHPGGTLMYDAMDLTFERITRNVDGRNAVIVLSDGDDSGSTFTLDQVIAAAQVSNTVIYTVFYSSKSLGYPATLAKGELTGKQVMEKLANETGGHMYEISAKEPVEKVFDAIAEEMRMQYMLAYSPAKQGQGEGFRKIQLVGKDKSWKVQTRSGYYYQGIVQ